MRSFLSSFISGFLHGFPGSRFCIAQGDVLIFLPDGETQRFIDRLLREGVDGEVIEKFGSMVRIPGRAIQLRVPPENIIDISSSRPGADDERFAKAFQSFVPAGHRRAS